VGDPSYSAPQLPHSTPLPRHSASVFSQIRFLHKNRADPRNPLITTHLRSSSRTRIPHTVFSPPLVPAAIRLRPFHSSRPLPSSRPDAKIHRYRP